MPSQKIDYAIIFSKRSFLNNVFRQEAKRRGILQENHLVTHQTIECTSFIKQHANSLLFLDWDMGAEAVQEVLKTRQELFQCEQQPCIVVASKMSDDIVSVCGEYAVQKVHTGEITAVTIQGVIKELIDEYDKLTPYRQVLIRCEKARKEGDLETVEKILSELHGKSPDNEDIASEYATTLMDSDKWEPAHAVIAPFESDRLENPRLLHLLARSYLQQNDHDSALKALESAQILSPFNIDRLLAIGDLLIEEEREDEACKSFDAILAIDGNSTKATSGKGTALLMMGEVNEALQLMQTHSKRDLASIFNNAAIICVKQNNYEKAIKLYESCLMAIGSNKNLRAKLYFNRGVLFNKWQKVPEAIDCFRKVIELNPDHEDAQHNIRALQSMRKQKAVGAETVPDSISLELDTELEETEAETIL